MVNIKCINRKEKIRKISEISKVRKCLKYNIVDIMQEIIQRNWRKGRAFIPAFILILCMCLTGCGSGNDIVKDYGVSQETEGKSNGESISEKIYASGETVRDMLGSANVEYEDSFDSGGIPVEVNVKGFVPDVPTLNTYQVEDIKEFTANEEKVVDNLFGDTAEKLDKVPEPLQFVDDSGKTYYSDNELWQWYSDIYFEDIFAKQYDMEEQKRLLTSNDFYKWLDAPEGYIHIYKGKYNNMEFGLIYAYCDNDMTGYITFALINPADYFPDMNAFQCMSDNRMDIGYNEDGDLELNITDSDAYQNDNELGRIISGRTNAMEGREDEALNAARSFIIDYLLVSCPNEMAAFSFDSDFKGQLLFIDKEEAAGSLNDDSGLLDGYFVNYASRFNGLTVPDYSGNITAMKNQGYVKTASGGVYSAFINVQMNIKDVTENVRLLDGERITESFRDIVSEKLDHDKLAGRNKLYFTSMKMYYYPIQNPSVETEFTYIPVWEFKTNDDNKGKSPVCVLVNAIDGSLVDVVY